MTGTRSEAADGCATGRPAASGRREDDPSARGFDAVGAFHDHAGELFGFARRSLGDANLAEDAVQETFVRAWRARDRFDADVAPVRTWLFAISRRVVIDLARSRTAHDRRTSDFAAQTPVVTDGEIDRALSSWIVEDAVRLLRPEHKEVLEEVYFSDRSCVEVAAGMGVPEGTVRSRLFYALRSLRLIVEERGFEL